MHPSTPVVWLAIAVFILAGIGILIARRRIADMQSVLAGGSIGPGCVVAEAVLLFLMAVAAFVLRPAIG